jgi:ClpP class serine protease
VAGNTSHAAWIPTRLKWYMKKKTEPVDDLLDALVWMRRKAKRHEAVDDLIDALMKMRRKAKKKVAKRKRPVKKRAKSKG